MRAVPEVESAYNRGRESGSFEARLESAEEWLDALNGHLADVAEQLRGFGLTMQGLADRFDAAAQTAIATAAALEKAEVVRRKNAEETWTPLTRIFAALAALSTLFAVLLAIKLFLLH